MIEQPAIFSPCRRWRYTLRRVWEQPRRMFEDSGADMLGRPIIAMSPRAMVAFIGLNPSTADETKDDPTVRRCVGFAKRWGFGGMFMLNIFAFRSTDPKELYAQEDPVGTENNHYITQVIQQPGVGLVVACWGNHGGDSIKGRWSGFADRGSEVVWRVQSAGRLNFCRLGDLTKLGQPRHPLYLKGDLMPVPL